MSEHDANRALLDTARLRIVDDPLEQTQRMPVYDRRYRQHEGRYTHKQLRGEGHARAMVNNPVYRAQEEARVQRNVYTDIDARVYAYLQSLGMTDEAVRNLATRSPDFRDGRCVHGESHFTCPVCGVQMGRRDNE